MSHQPASTLLMIPGSESLVLPGKKSSLSLLLFIILTHVNGQSPAGFGWSKTSVNAVVFRKNSVVTDAGRMTQYTAFYDSTGHVVLAKRKLPDGGWESKRTDLSGKVTDAHNTISIMVDGKGYLHIAWDHHNHPLRYRRSVSPGSFELTGNLPMMGTNEEDVTYPEFHRLPSGDLIFMYRSGMSGRGNLVMNRYDIKTMLWSRVQDVLIDGEGQRNAYWQAYVDHRGTIHLSWVWRETWDVATNHDLCYARSSDGGKTWERSTGEVYTLPINASNAEYACIIPQKSELINQTSMYADEHGRPYIATYWRPAGSTIPQYFMVYHDGSGWRQQQVTKRTTPFSLSGGGTKKIPISRPQLVIQQKAGQSKAMMIFRDAERGYKVSVATCQDISKGSWSFRDVTDFAVSDWEPSYDTELWKEKGILHLFVQRVGQGDGEKAEDLGPQPVYILEIKP